jgi:hypothetical protein
MLGGGEFGDGCLGVGSLGGDDGQAGFGQYFEAHVAAAFAPFVGLFGQDGADESDDGGAVGEDPDDVGAAADLLVQPFLGVVAPDLTPDVAGERGEGQELFTGVVEVIGSVGEPLGQGRDGACVLGADGVDVRLVEDRTDQRGDPRLRRFRDLRQQVAQVVRL